MATNMKKGKGGKDADKKSSKRSEESPSIEEPIEETTPVAEEVSESPDVPSVVEEPPPKEPTPEPVYEEPVLTQLIVENYVGDKVRGLYDGEGEAYFAGGHHYQGHFTEGLMHGPGVYSWADGVIYEGEFTLNKITGKGLYKWGDGSSYEGEVQNGLRHGYGTFRCPGNKMSYTGEWVMGKRQGKGRMDYDAQGVSFYEGDWETNTRHGWGTRRYPSGNIYQGMWFNNVRHGEGTMRWLDTEQMYTGRWENGIQHGMGQHIWFLRRVAGSQYPLRNMYDGQFSKGLRNGFGTYYYANGARYEGEWINNMKCGKGKFVFKNGRVYEGQFEKDHIVEFPSFEMDAVATPDLSQIRTRTPLPSEAMSVHSNDSRNTYSPSFQLDVDHLLAEFPESDREEEAAQVIFVIMRHVTSLRKIYNYYSVLGYEDSPDNTFILNRMQLWRLLKDCCFHHRGLTLTEMDRILAPTKGLQDDMHNPYTKILFREFTNNLVTIAYHLYQEEHEGTSPMLAWCLSKAISENILKRACSVKGNIYYETRRGVNAMVHLDQAYEVYKSFCTPRKAEPHDPSLKMRQFLFMLQDLKLVNADLTAKAIVTVLGADDPNMLDKEGAINMELEMTFLEFFEALVGCAEVFVTEAVVKDPSTPRPSTAYTHADRHSVHTAATASRGASRGDADHPGSPHEGDTVTGSPAPRTGSQMTSKTADGSSKPEVLEKAGLSPGSQTLKHAHAVDKRRRYHHSVASTREGKKSRLRRKKLRFQNESSCELREGPTYQSDVGIQQPVVDVTSIPPALEQPKAVSLDPDVHQSVTQVFFDLETSGLGFQPDIIQIAACHNQRQFNRYILPHGKLSPKVSEVTGITVQGSAMFYKGEPVSVTPLQSALQDFISFLPDNTMLVGHNIQAFDNRILLLHLMDLNLADLLRTKVVGFLDTLKLSRQLYPARTGDFKQETLFKDIVGTTYVAHNALGDVTALETLFTNMKPSSTIVNENSIKYDSTLAIVKHSLMTRQNKSTLHSLIQSKSLSDGMAKKIASSGLRLDHLKLSFDRNGEEGLRSLFTEPTENSVRVTKNQNVILKVSNYLKSLK